MRVVRRGLRRDEGWYCLVEENDPVDFKPIEGEIFAAVLLSVTTDRKAPPGTIPEASHRFEMKLSAEEIVRCLLTMSPESIAGALDSIAYKMDVRPNLPEIVKQLTAGALAIKHDVAFSD